MKDQRFSLVTRIILFQLIFLLLHYLYDWIPGYFTMLFSGINESVFQHMKIGFFSCIIAALLEYLWVCKRLVSTKKFLCARLFSTVFYPWVMMTLFLISPVILVKTNSIPGEIIFANIALLCTTLVVVLAERQVEKTEPSRSFITVLSALFIILTTEFIIFTHHLPWFDIFSNPPGW